MSSDLYYKDRDALPTHANLDERGWEEYERLRRLMFMRLRFPPGMFSERRVLEFGPDSGENSVVFSRWGAKLTLVEPHGKARAQLDINLKGQSPLGYTILPCSMMEFETSHPYDIVDAEGFVYTIKDDWIQKAHDCLQPGGWFIFSYMEKLDSIIELQTKEIFKRVSAIDDRVDLAWYLFGNKWNTVKHTRPFSAWVMDVLENPFVSESYMIDAADLLRDMHAHGFRYYSSWPDYRSDTNRWIKSPENSEHDLADMIYKLDAREEIGLDIDTLHSTELARFASEDTAFLNMWGNPNHYAIFQKI